MWLDRFVIRHNRSSIAGRLPKELKAVEVVVRLGPRSEFGDMIALQTMSVLLRFNP